MQELPIHLLDPIDYDAVFEMARRLDLNIYDAAYLELALRLDVPLATLDKKLAETAAEAGVAGFGVWRPARPSRRFENQIPLIPNHLRKGLPRTLGAGPYNRSRESP